MAKKINTTESATPVDTNVFKYGSDFNIDLAAVPMNSLHAMAQRTFSHILGNEGAAALVAERKRRSENPMNDAEEATWLYDWRTAKVSAILAGQLGVRATGPRVVGIDKFIREVVMEHLSAMAAKQKKPMPKAAEDRQKLIARFMEKFGDKVKAEAERRMADASEGEELEL